MFVILSGSGALFCGFLSPQQQTATRIVEQKLDHINFGMMILPDLVSCKTYFPSHTGEESCCFSKARAVSNPKDNFPSGCRTARIVRFSERVSET